MAVQNVPRKVGPLTGNGIIKTFSFTFKAIRPSDVVVKISSGDEVTDEETLPEYGTDYTVTLNTDQDVSAGGTVTFAVAPEQGSRIAITSDTEIDQQLVLTNHDGFLPESLNDAYDKLTIICQELKDALTRCITIPLTLTKTPQEVLSDLLEVAAKANEYAQNAQEIYLSVSTDVAEIKALKSEIDELIVTFEQVSALVEEAQENKEATDDNLLECQQILAKVSNTALTSGFAIRTIASCTANETFPISNLNPSVNTKPGDLIFSASDCKLYQVTSVTASHATVGALVAGLKGEKGDQGVQGVPGPAGEQGEQGPMGQSPYATCFGQFQVKPSGMLCLEVVGLAPATFTINEHGVVEATYDNS